MLTGAPRWAGALIGGGIMTIYFTAGGLLGSAWVNTLQLVVMLGGFAGRAAGRAGVVGGSDGVDSATCRAFGDITVFVGTGLGLDAARAARPGVHHLAGPDSRSLWRAQRARAAHRRRAQRGGAAAVRVRAGAARHGARVALPASPTPNAVLPDRAREQLPPWLGALALAAVFSTEVDTCDAILFMISTSASKDLYKRFLRPAASDASCCGSARDGGRRRGRRRAAVDLAADRDRRDDRLLLAARRHAVRAGARRPVSGAPVGRKPSPRSWRASSTLLVVRFGVAGRYPWLDPTLTGLIAAAIAFFVAFVGALRVQRSADRVQP